MFLSVELGFRRPIYPPLYSLAKNFRRERCFNFAASLRRRYSSVHFDHLF
jgi:hypothetical protein